MIDFAEDTSSFNKEINEIAELGYSFFKNKISYKKLLKNISEFIPPDYIAKFQFDFDIFDIAKNHSQQAMNIFEYVLLMLFVRKEQQSNSDSDDYSFINDYVITYKSGFK